MAERTHKTVRGYTEAASAREIVDLSHPKGKSVNDGIEPELCSLRYTSVDEVSQVGCRTWLTKLDVEAAYRIVPVHPEDRQLLGMLWGEELFIDTPLGFRSAPKIFNALADGLWWILEGQGANRNTLPGRFSVF